MSRLYYDDPLAAAWMAKHFGVRFPIERGTNTPNAGGCYSTTTLCTHDTWKRTGGQNTPDRYYVHADSLHLLKPQLGDVIYAADDGARCVNRVFTLEMAEEWIGWGNRIIQRGNKPFHWPLKDLPETAKKILAAQQIHHDSTYY